jgi:hypothetical protein
VRREADAASRARMCEAASLDPERKWEVGWGWEREGQREKGRKPSPTGPWESDVRVLSMKAEMNEALRRRETSPPSPFCPLPSESASDLGGVTSSDCERRSSFRTHTARFAHSESRIHPLRISSCAFPDSTMSAAPFTTGAMAPVVPGTGAVPGTKTGVVRDRRWRLANLTGLTFFIGFLLWLIGSAIQAGAQGRFIANFLPPASPGGLPTLTSAAVVSGGTFTAGAVLWCVE